MQSPDNAHNPAPHLPGGNGSELPGFLAPKLAPLRADAAPGSFADIQARLKAERRRRAIWLWSLGLAVLLAGGLLALRYTRSGAMPSDPQMASQAEAPAQVADARPSASTLSTADPADPAGPRASRPMTAQAAAPADADPLSSPANQGQATKGTLPKPYAPASQPRRATTSAPKPRQEVMARVFQPGPLPETPSSTKPGPQNAPATNEDVAAQSSWVAAAPKLVNPTPPAEPPAPRAQASQPTPAPGQVSVPATPALPLPVAEPAVVAIAAEPATQQATAPAASLVPRTDAQPIAPATASQVLPPAAKPAVEDSAVAAPATVTPTAPAPRPTRWQWGLAAGAGVFNRQMLVPGTQGQEFEPTGLRSGLALGAQVVLGYRLTSRLAAEVALGLGYGQATLSRRRFGQGSGYNYVPIAGGFAATPITTSQIMDTPLDYTLASLQAGLAWQAAARWRARIRGGLQQTVAQQAPLAGTALPALAYPVGGALLYRLAGPLWAGADVSYFGSGRGRANSSALLLVEYRWGK